MLRPRGSRLRAASRRIVRAAPARRIRFGVRGARRVGHDRAGRRQQGVQPAIRYHPPRVRTDRAALGTARHQRPGPGGSLGVDRRVRPRRVAPRERRPGRRRAFHGAHHLQGHECVPEHAADQRGDRRRRRILQRRHRPRIDGLLGPCPGSRGRPGDGRDRRADRPAAARGPATSRASAP